MATVAERRSREVSCRICPSCDSCLLGSRSPPRDASAGRSWRWPGCCPRRRSPPIPEGAIRRDDDRAAFIPGGDDLEQEVRTALVDGQIGGDDSLGAARGGWSYPPRALCPRSIVPLRLPIDDIPRTLPVESRRRNKKNQTSCDDKASCNAAKETRKETQQKCSGPEGDHGRICLPLARNPRRPQGRPHSTALRKATKSPCSFPKTRIRLAGSYGN